MSIQDEFKAGFDKWAEPLEQKRLEAQEQQRRSAERRVAGIELLERAFEQMDAENHDRITHREETP